MLDTGIRLIHGRCVEAPNSNDITVLIVIAATVGQAVLTLSILVFRSAQRVWYVPLAVFFLANSVTDLASLTPWIGPGLGMYLNILTYPALMLLGPCLWLYVSGLTSETEWRFGRSDGEHLLPFLYASIVAVMIVVMPYETRSQLVLDGLDIETTYEFVVGVMLLSLALVWLVQTACYIVLILRRLFVYRQRLKDVFASTEQSELGWFLWVLMLLGVSWVLMLTSMVGGIFYDREFVDPHVDAFVSLTFVWTLSVWGLRQKPGFESEYGRATLQPASNEENRAKYERSALSPEQSQRLATKIESAMRNDRLYADAGLSLRDLSDHIRVTPNYVSQTLNETIGRNFFDYVNSWRIDEAKPLVAQNTDTILTIAHTVGFNSRSAFYKAFKKETGMVPSVFRNKPVQ